MIIYSCCSSVAQREGGARSTALARLVGRKADRRRDVLLPQDGVNAVYLVIRMLFLAFFFFFFSPWLSLFSVLLSCWGSWLRGQPGVLGWEQQHPMPPTC